MKNKIVGLWSVNKNIGCFDPSIKNSHYVRVFVIAVLSLISIESLSYACVTSLDFAEIRFIFFPLCDCNKAAPMPKFEA